MDDARFVCSDGVGLELSPPALLITQHPNTMLRSIGSAHLGDGEFSTVQKGNAEWLDAPHLQGVHDQTARWHQPILQIRTTTQCNGDRGREHVVIPKYSIALELKTLLCKTMEHTVSPAITLETSSTSALGIKNYRLIDPHVLQRYSFSGGVQLVLFPSKCSTLLLGA